MANAKTWRIKKWWMSKFEEVLRTSSAGHLAVGLIRGDCACTWRPTLEVKDEVETIHKYSLKVLGYLKVLKNLHIKVTKQTNCKNVNNSFFLEGRWTLGK